MGADRSRTSAYYPAARHGDHCATAATRRGEVERATSANLASERRVDRDDRLISVLATNFSVQADLVVGISHGLPSELY